MLLSLHPFLILGFAAHICAGVYTNSTNQIVPVTTQYITQTVTTVVTKVLIGPQCQTIIVEPEFYLYLAASTVSTTVTRWTTVFQNCPTQGVYTVGTTTTKVTNAPTVVFCPVPQLTIITGSPQATTGGSNSPEIVVVSHTQSGGVVYTAYTIYCETIIGVSISTSTPPATRPTNPNGASPTTTPAATTPTPSIGMNTNTPSLGSTQYLNTSLAAAFKAQVVSPTGCTVSSAPSIPTLTPVNGTDAAIGFDGITPNIYIQIQNDAPFVLAVTSTTLTVKNAALGDFGIDSQGNFFYISADCSVEYYFSAVGQPASSRKRFNEKRAPPATIFIAVQFLNQFLQPNDCSTNGVFQCIDPKSGLSQQSYLEYSGAVGFYTGSCPFPELDTYNTCFSVTSGLVTAFASLVTLRSVVNTIVALESSGTAALCLSLAADALVALGLAGGALTAAVAALAAGVALAIPGAVAVAAFFATCTYALNKLEVLFLDITLDQIVNVLKTGPLTPDFICKSLGKVGDDVEVYTIDILYASATLTEVDIYGISTTDLDLTVINTSTCSTSTDSSAAATTTATTTTAATTTTDTASATVSAMPTSTPSLTCNIPEGMFCDQGLTGDQTQCCTSGDVCLDYLCVPQCDSPGVNCSPIPPICKSVCGAQNAPGTPAGI